ncbi:nitroreductase family protein [Staphylococcus gallinarum]|uniref:nitroreductase family protein n=1 Tax=Staphylococcus gallinarum TaxID=1293 RepID=UPI000D1E4143|nr:nitroreductase [Staphylococcus gallinarum]MBU7218708.1 nitroreductase [Staphylococcus gallinarum]MCD8794353.1 nitroreductase [Staphylococcus gallinarum]PTK89442.1 nitroreductase [Staphylococcus gallinarum]RIO85243.1 nitroreductase [Staphylococcus gallinarum]
MELQEAISQRRSVKIFKRDMTIDQDALYDAIKKAADAPNHGHREPWRVIHVAKDRLGNMSKQLTQIAFHDKPKKQEDHYQVVTNLGGMLVLILKEDPHQLEGLEDHLAFGAYVQNLMLLLHEAGIGTCWKTPPYIFDKEVQALFNIQENERLLGFLYLTDLEDKMNYRPRHTENLIEKF